MALKVFYEKGLCVQDGKRRVLLDPTRRSDDAVVSHAHMDHLTKGATMTPQTLDVMEVRKGGRDATPLEYGKTGEVGGFDVTLHEAGHVFGSAMVELDGLLYTGDFNPEGGLTCGKAEPRPVDTLVMEATYGSPDLRLPPKDGVLNDLLAWVEYQTDNGPVAIGAYEFGKAQEVIALVNGLGVPVLVPDKVARLSDVHRRHGLALDYTPLGELDGLPDYPYVLVASPGMFRKPGTLMRDFRRQGGSAAFVSGWCARFNYIHSYGLDAQFPLSDHADFDDLLWFAEQCGPRQVYTTHGSAEVLAREITRRSGLKAEAL